MTTAGRPDSALVSSPGTGSHQPANLGDILERVLDKGLVIAGDIQVNLLDIELLTIKLRLVVASLETAREVGINWWENDPWLTGSNDHRRLEQENRRLRGRVAELEAAETAETAPGPDETERENRRLRGRLAELEAATEPVEVDPDE